MHIQYNKGMKKKAIILGSIVSMAIPAVTTISCVAAVLPDPNKPVKSVEEIQKSKPGFGEINHFKSTTATHAEKIRGIAEAYFSDWKWYKFYLPTSDPYRENAFIELLAELKYRIDLLSSSAANIALAKESWGQQIYAESDPAPEHFIITKESFVTLLNSMLGEYASGYDWFINPIIEKLTTNL